MSVHKRVDMIESPGRTSIVFYVVRNGENHIVDVVEVDKVGETELKLIREFFHG